MRGGCTIVDHAQYSTVVLRDAAKRMHQFGIRAITLGALRCSQYSDYPSSRDLALDENFHRVIAELVPGNLHRSMNARAKLPLTALPAEKPLKPATR